MKKKKVKIPYSVLFSRLEKALAEYQAAKNPDTIECVRDVCKEVVANTVNPSTPPPPPPPPPPKP